MRRDGETRFRRKVKSQKVKLDLGSNSFIWTFGFVLAARRDGEYVGNMPFEIHDFEISPEGSYSRHFACDSSQCSQLRVQVRVRRS